jgi:N-acetylmuramoyl-L-alanine amidase
VANLYLSGSQQEANQFAGAGVGYTDSEEYWAGLVVNEAAVLLRAAGHTVRVGNNGSAAANAADANAWWRAGKQHKYVAWHTNAGGGAGTEVWCYGTSATDRSAGGWALASKVYPRVAAESDNPDRGIKYSKGFIELKDPIAPAIIVEALFHDRATEAAEMRRDYKKFARALAQGLCDLVGGTLPPVVVPTPPAPPIVVPPVPPTPATPTWKVSAQTDSTITLTKA